MIDYTSIESIKNTDRCEHTGKNTPEVPGSLARTLMKTSYSPFLSTSTTANNPWFQNQGDPRLCTPLQMCLEMKGYQATLIFSGGNISAIHIDFSSHSYNMFILVFCVNFPDHNKGRGQKNIGGSFVENLKWWTNLISHVKSTWMGDSSSSPHSNIMIKFYICILEGVCCEFFSKSGLSNGL